MIDLEYHKYCWLCGKLNDYNNWSITRDDLGDPHVVCLECKRR